MVTGNGSRALFARLMAACAASRGTAVLPSGSYGGFVATARFFGVDVAVVPPASGTEGGFKLQPSAVSDTECTLSAAGWKRRIPRSLEVDPCIQSLCFRTFLFTMNFELQALTSASLLCLLTSSSPPSPPSHLPPLTLSRQLDSFLSSISRPWLILSAPIVNPTGALYSSSEIAALLSVCQRRGAKVILDVCFSDLQFEGNDGKNQIDLEPFLGKGDNKGVTDALVATDKATDVPAPGAAAAVGDDSPVSSPQSYALALLGQLSPQVSGSP